MKRAIITLAFLAAAIQAGAATVTVGVSTKNTTAAQDTAILNLVASRNAANCKAVGLAVGCSDASYQAAPLHQAGVIIYPATGAGAAQFILDLIFVKIDTEVIEQANAINLDAAKTAFTSATPAQQSAACVALGKDGATCK